MTREERDEIRRSGHGLGGCGDVYARLVEGSLTEITILSDGQQVVMTESEMNDLMRWWATTRGQIGSSHSVLR